MMAKQWSNRFSFIISASAFAIGLGNIWRFPYITGESGGGAFLLVYLLLAAVIGLPILLIELGLGRMSKSSPLTGFGRLTGKPKWNGIGWLGVAAGLLIKMYYVMILAWIAIYFLQSLSGTLTELQPAQLANHFDSVAGNSLNIFGAILVIVILAVLVVRKDLAKGLEPVARVLMTLLFGLILVLAIWSCTLDGTAEGLRFYLTPDFSKLSIDVFLSALGQLFFSVGVGMAAAFVFGSYTSANENLISSTIWIVLADTLIAILAGFMIFPALFTYGLSPDSGPNLIFITMGTFFNNMAAGRIFASLFFLLLFIAGFTSLISVMQGLKESLSDRFGFKSDRALYLVASLVFLGSIPMVYSFAVNPIQIAGKTIYELFDFLTNSVMLPLTALMLILFGAYVIGFEKLVTALASNSKFKISNYWSPVIKYLIPAFVFVIFLKAILP